MPTLEGKARRRKTIKVRPLFDSMASIRTANKSIGHHFFDRAAMKAFNSKVESGVSGGRCFISS